MRKALSAKAIEAFKPQERRYEVHDVLCPGFSLRVFPTGRKVFSVKYRYGLKQRRLPIGVHPRISLAEARNRAIDALRLVDEGIDPAARRRQLGMNVESICGDFIRQYARPRNRSWKEAERILQREFVAVHGQRDIREIKRHDILELMDGAIERGAAYQANRIHSNLLSDVPEVIARVHSALSGLGVAASPPEPELKPAVSIRASVRPDHIVCLEDGKKMKMLKRHLATDHGMSPADYRAKWNLPADYPLVAPNYAAQRKELALKIGLGRKPKVPAKAATKAPALRPRAAKTAKT